MDGRPSKRRLEARSQTTPSADDAALGVVVTTARIAFGAARMLAWAPGVRPFLQRSAATGREARERGRERIEHAARTALSGPEVGRLVDDALAGPLPEAVARSSVEHHVGDRVAAQLEPERERLIQQVLDSPDFERALEKALSSPKVRAALASQTTSLAAEIAEDVHRRAVPLDRRLSFGRARNEVSYAGGGSRALAFVIDLVLAQLAFLVGAAVIGVVASFVDALRPAWLLGALAGSGWLLLVGAYFVFFWTLGQTPGMRILHLRVLVETGEPPRAARAVLRFAALLLAIIPLFAGLWPVLFTARRRGLQDFIARTVVVYTD